MDVDAERARRRADAALDVGPIGEQFGEQRRQQVRVLDARIVAPVGEVHPFLHALAMEGAVWEAVDGRHVVIAGAEKFTESGEGVSRRQGLRGLRGQPQADSKWAIVPKEHTNAGQGIRQRCADLFPCFAWMYVRAVGEVKAVADLHRRRSRVPAIMRG